MSLATYSDLRTALTTRLDVTTSDISNANADDLFTEAEKRIYRELRIRAMETAFSGTIASGVVAVPSDYLAMKFAYVNTSPVVMLQRKTAQWIYLNYPNRGSSGKPKFYAREVNNFVFGPYPDSAYTILGVYYAKPSTVVNTTLTGALLTNPDLLLYAACAEAEKFLGRESRVGVWESRYEQVKRQVEMEDATEEGSGGPLAMTWA